MSSPSTMNTTVNIPLQDLSNDEIVLFLSNSGFHKCITGVIDNEISGFNLHDCENIEDLKSFASDLIPLKLKELLKTVVKAKDEGVPTRLLSLNTNNSKQSMISLSSNSNSNSTFDDDLDISIEEIYPCPLPEDVNKLVDKLNKEKEKENNGNVSLLNISTTSNNNNADNNNYNNIVNTMTDELISSSSSFNINSNDVISPTTASAPVMSADVMSFFDENPQHMQMHIQIHEEEEGVVDNEGSSVHVPVLIVSNREDADSTCTTLRTVLLDGPVQYSTQYSTQPLVQPSITQEQHKISRLETSKHENNNPVSSTCTTTGHVPVQYADANVTVQYATVPEDVMTALTNELKETKKALSACKLTISSLEQSNIVLKKEISVQERGNFMATSKVADLTVQLKCLQNKYNDVLEQKSVLQEEITCLQETVTLRDKKILECTDELGQLQYVIDKLSVDNKTMQSRFEQSPGSSPTVQSAPIAGTSEEINYRFVEAGSRGFVTSLKQYLTQGANINHTDKHGNTAIFNASANGHIAAVEWLVKTYADVNIANCTGSTPLIKALEGKHVTIAKMLIKIGNADVNLRTNIGNTALSVARAKSLSEIILMLDR